MNNLESKNEIVTQRLQKIYAILYHQTKTGNISSFKNLLVHLEIRAMYKVETQCQFANFRLWMKFIVCSVFKGNIYYRTWNYGKHFGTVSSYCVRSWTSVPRFYTSGNTFPKGGFLGCFLFFVFWVLLGLLAQYLKTTLYAFNCQNDICCHITFLKLEPLDYKIQHWRGLIPQTVHEMQLMNIK